MTLAEWYTAHDAEAAAEGWSIFEASGGDYDDELIVARIDDVGLIDGDLAAWQLVWRRAQEGSACHRDALELIRRESPGEYQRIELEMTS